MIESEKMTFIKTGEIIRKIEQHEERIDTTTTHGYEGSEELQRTIWFFKDAMSNTNDKTRYGAAREIVRIYDKLDMQNCIVRSNSSKKYEELLAKYDKCIKQKKLLKARLEETTEQLHKSHARYQELAKIYDSFRKVHQ